MAIFLKKGVKISCTLARKGHFENGRHSRAIWPFLVKSVKMWVTLARNGVFLVNLWEYVGILWIFVDLVEIRRLF